MAKLPADKPRVSFGSSVSTGERAKLVGLFVVAVIIVGVMLATAVFSSRKIGVKETSIASFGDEEAFRNSVPLPAPPPAPPFTADESAFEGVVDSDAMMLEGRTGIELEEEALVYLLHRARTTSPADIDELIAADAAGGAGPVEIYSVDGITGDPEAYRGKAARLTARFRDWHTYGLAA